MLLQAIFCFTFIDEEFHHFFKDSFHFKISMLKISLNNAIINQHCWTLYQTLNAIYLFIHAGHLTIPKKKCLFVAWETRMQRVIWELMYKRCYQIPLIISKKLRLGDSIWKRWFLLILDDLRDYDIAALVQYHYNYGEFNCWYISLSCLCIGSLLCVCIDEMFMSTYTHILNTVRIYIKA